MSSIPIPPHDLVVRTGSLGPAGFLREGRRLKECLLRMFPLDVELRPGARFLDFGCGSGRLEQQLEAESAWLEIHGCDIDAKSIDWLRANASPPFHFHLTGEVPPLPFPDEHFDVVVALSVFTHLPWTWRAWLEELRRVLKPGGIAMLSYATRAVWSSFGHALGDFDPLGEHIDGADRSWDEGGPTVFYGDAWIASRWSEVLRVRALFAEGVDGFQSMAVLQKEPARASPLHRAQPFAFQPVRRDFRGYFDFEPFAHESWWRSHGRPAALGELTGWFLSDGAPIERVWCEHAGSTFELEALPRPDADAEFAGSPHASRGFRLPLARVLRGDAAHELLVVQARDASGRTHYLELPIQNA
ncbi:MAG: class I SAM-dependent methyltransferase [Planctomycetes bacterium]|nr:class I SAM-dependent methyltransferase [Planctomycetota bacterium]